MGSENEVGISPGHDVLSLILGSSENGVADDGTKAVNLRTELNLDWLSGLEHDLRLFLVRGQWGVRCDKRAGGDGGRVRET